MDDTTIHCPACGRKLPLPDAQAKAEDDPHATLTCPTCGAGFDRDGNLVHEPAIGP
jgi:transposase